MIRDMLEQRKDLQENLFIRGFSFQISCRSDWRNFRFTEIGKHSGTAAIIFNT